MLVSTKGRYALRVMLDIAEHQEQEDFIALKDIADRQEISVKYLESIMKSLVKVHLVEGTRGKGGGYKLVKKPSQVKVSQILTAAEGTLAPVVCLEKKHNTCARAENCKTLPMWKSLQENINEFFEGITLEDLLKDPSAIEL